MEEMYLVSQSQYIKKRFSEKMVFVTHFPLSRKLLTARQIAERHVSEKSYDLILHIALVSKQMLKVYS